MRAIRVRGKSLMGTEKLDQIGISHDNGWVFGAYIDEYIVSGVIEATDEYIDLESWCLVIPETVGQYTGLKDMNGTKIYEGDILRNVLNRFVDNEPFQIFFSADWSGWYWKDSRNGTDCFYNSIALNCKVIGNIYENPELLTEV